MLTRRLWASAVLIVFLAACAGQAAQPTEEALPAEEEIAEPAEEASPADSQAELPGVEEEAAPPAAEPPEAEEAPPVEESAELETMMPSACSTEFALPAPFGTLEPAPIELAEPGYAAEWFIKPGVFNMPQEVLLTPEGDLLVYAVHDQTLYRVADDGTATILAELDWGGYQGTVDAQGNVYIHDHGGMIQRITPGGEHSVLTNSIPPGNCDSGFGLGPDGNLYAVQNTCDDTADLFQITPTGQVTLVAEAVPTLNALRTAHDGRFLGLGERTGRVYEISLDDYMLTELGAIPEGPWVAPGGLTTDESGNIYISTGRTQPGAVYLLDPSGGIRTLAEIPDNGLSGIEWLRDTGEIVGGTIITGKVIAVSPEGGLREIVSGNDIVTPAGIGFSPCGELAVTNDEGGIMAFFDPAGGASWSFDYVATSPPFSYVVFDSGGTLYASEADPAPDDIRRVVAMHPGEQLEHFVSADFPSGLALRADGALLVSETAAGRITLVNPDGSTDVVAEGLAFPEALALDADGSIYAVTGPAGFTPRESTPVPFTGDTIIRITQEGEVATVARLQDVVALAVGPGGDLFATVAGTVLSGREGSQVVRISSDGTQTLVASGLRDAIGLAFDLAGSLYVADWTANGIVRIGGFPQGTLSGVVTDASGAPIEGACVHVLAVAPIVVGQVVFTDAEGRFTLPAAPRTYSLTVTYDDATITLQDVAVSADEETALEIAL